ncbi:MAG: hypothetical protein GTO24_15280, partial [candidate division Zixibacteria bacterium]|nr:hypothetical protein [candidate division Zixibacteria bacterium]
MMEKTTISKQVGVVLVTLAIILGFTGPAGSASKSGEETKSRGGQTIRFEPSLVTKKKFSSHTQKPRVSSAQEEKLLKAGYGMIGKMEVEHREKECYEGKKCKTLYRGKDQPTTALLKEAARQGADLVVMEKDN